MPNTKTIIYDRTHNYLTLNQLAAKYHLAWTTVKRILVENSAYLRKQNPIYTNTWNYKFFSKQTPITAYWAGFLFADGCVTKNNVGTRVHIIIANQDSGHLELLAKTMNFPTNKIMINKTQSKTLQFYTHGYSLLTDLAIWGIVPNKTYNFVTPTISQKFLPHFIRGWIDGDGCITIKPRQQRLELVGNNYAIDWYINSLRNLGYNKHIAVYGNKNKVWKRALITGVNQIRELAILVHALDNYPKLERKWLPFQK
jgi:hypothetical protein